MKVHGKSNSYCKQKRYAGQEKFPSLLTLAVLVFLWFLIVPSRLNAQQYTYAVESFEGSGWPSSEATSEVTVSTGKWTVRNGVTQSSVTPASGSKYLYFASSGYFQTPELTAGAGTLTFKASSTDGRRSTTILASTDGKDFEDIFATGALPNTGWQLVTVPIKNANVKFLRFSSRDVLFDDVLVTPLSFTIKPEILASLNYIQNTGTSAAEPFTLSASELVAGAPVVITAPKNFEVTVNGIEWGSTATILNTAGGTLSETVYIRLVSGLSTGDYSGTLSISGGGKAAPITSTIKGTVTAATKPVCVSGKFLSPSRRENFGTFPTELSRASAEQFSIDTIFKYKSAGGIGDFSYAVVANSNTDGWTTKGLDHTPDDPAGTFGGMLFVNNGETAGKVIFRRAWPVCSGMDLTMSAWYADANNHTTFEDHIHAPGITFYIYGGNSPDNCNTLIVKKSETPPFVKSLEQIWHQILVPFNTGNYTYIKLQITNDVNEIKGNDILIDDIEFPTVPLPVEVCVTNVSCNGACDGVINIARVSGNSTFNFELDGKTKVTGTEASFKNVCAGPHTLKISDLSGGCDVVPEVVVNEPDKLVAKAVTISACGVGGTIGMIVTGGTPGYEYKVGSGEWGRNSTITGLSNGSHTIEVRDAHGCTTTATATVSAGASATLTLASDPGTDAQTVFSNAPLAEIRYTVGGDAKGAEATGLPTGLSASYASGVFKISGTPTQSGTFKYTVTTSGTDPACTASKTGTITINLSVIADVLDENGNGFIDRINVTLEDQGSTVLSDKLPAVGEFIKSLKITNHYGSEITLKPQKIERVSDKTFSVVLTENNGTEFETGWKSADFSTNSVSLVTSGAFITRINIVDKAGPVIRKALLSAGEGDGTNNVDTLIVSFSEPLQWLQASTTPQDVFQYYQFTTKTDAAFDGLKSSDLRISNDKLSAKIVMSNDYVIQPTEDSLQLKSVAAHVTDLTGNGAHNPSRIAPIEGTARVKVVGVTLTLRDANGNGFIDNIEINLPDNYSLAATLPDAKSFFSKLALKTYTGNATLQPKQITRVSDRKITIDLTENSGNQFETGWESSTIEITNTPLTVDKRVLRVKEVIDNAGPVIARVLYEYGPEGKNEDVLKITFSEPVALKRSEASPPSEVFNYYQREKISTKAFESIGVQSFTFEADKRNATVIMTNGFFVLPMFDSLQLKQAPDHLVDAAGNSAHAKSRITVIEGKVRFTIDVKPVVNPYEQGSTLPDKFLTYYSDVLKNGNKNVVLVAVQSTLPLNSTGNGTFGSASIYDGVGNLVQRDIPVYQANSPTDYGFTWNTKNENQRYVSKGVYLAIIRVRDLFNTEHVFKEKIGIK
jgi:hypothetical protein